MSASDDDDAPPPAAPAGKRDRVRPVQKKRKLASVKNQLRSVERLLTKARAHSQPARAGLARAGSAGRGHACTHVLAGRGGDACASGVSADVRCVDAFGGGGGLRR
jgi:hypothetical protein